MDIKNQLARKLMDIKAIKLQPNDPFTWASGWKSPIYTDNRKTLSFTDLRSFVKLELCHAIQQHFPTIADRTEIERNGHGRAHGRGDLTSRPILGSQCVEVGRNAGIGNGQVSEADAVLVTHAYGAERVAHIEAV